MSEQYVTFYQIAKEIAEEEGRDFMLGGRIDDQGAFDNYRATKRRSLIEILKKINMLEKFQPKKGDDFQIPLSEKEVIKFFIRNHSEPLNKKVRQAKVENITGEDAKNFMNKFEALVLKNIPYEEWHEDAAILAAFTQVQSRYALDMAMVGLKEMWENDIGNLTWRPVSRDKDNVKLSNLGESTEKEIKIDNDGDAAFLISYYHHMMLEQSRKWNELVDIVDELRMEEKEVMINAQYGDDVDLDDNRIDFNVKYRNIWEVVMEARQIQYEMHMERLKPKKEITEEERRAVEDLLKRRSEDED